MVACAGTGTPSTGVQGLVSTSQSSPAAWHDADAVGAAECGPPGRSEGVWRVQVVVSLSWAMWSSVVVLAPLAGPFTAPGGLARRVSRRGPRAADRARTSDVTTAPPS